MGIMENAKKKLQSWLEITPPMAINVTVQETYDYVLNAVKNRIWYRGEANELEQLYEQIAMHTDRYKFWASKPTPGMEMRKIHTGLPSMIVDTLAGIVTTNINDIKIDNVKIADIWKHIEAENDFKRLVNNAVRETLYIGDGAFRISFDASLSDYPILEYYPGDKIEIVTKRGRVQEIVFKEKIEENGTHYVLKCHYGYGYITYDLWRGETEIDILTVQKTADLEAVKFGNADDKYILAVPVLFYASTKWAGRGESIFDKKIDAFDSFDEAWSQWLDALRSARTREYIPDTLLPRDPKTGVVLRPNSFDNRYIQTDSDASERGGNKITVEQPVIPHDSYNATYITALDLCLQGIISPSTLGIDVKKLDNADAQREKEKATLYTRDVIVDALQADLERLLDVAIKGYYDWRSEVVPDYTADITFGDYANPSFESQIETVGKGHSYGIMSTEACVDELYGDDRDAEWKAEEVKRLKTEQGIAELEESAIGSDMNEGEGWDAYISDVSKTS